MTKKLKKKSTNKNTLVKHSCTMYFVVRSYCNQWDCRRPAHKIHDGCTLYSLSRCEGWCFVVSALRLHSALTLCQQPVPFVFGCTISRRSHESVSHRMSLGFDFTVLLAGSRSPVAASGVSFIVQTVQQSCKGGILSETFRPASSVAPWDCYG